MKAVNIWLVFIRFKIVFKKLKIFLLTGKIDFNRLKLNRPTFTQALLASDFSSSIDQADRETFLKANPQIINYFI
jgi:hypothetical protein